MAQTISKKKASPAKKRRKQFFICLTRFFAGAVALLAVVNLILPSKDFSRKENRSLQKHPKVSLAALRDGSYFSDLDTYYSDQFVLRDSWMTLSSFGARLEGQKEHGDVFFGKHGYLFGKPGAFDPAASKATQDAINGFVSRHSDLNFYMLLAPAAANVLSDELPPFAPVSNQVRDIQEFEAKLQGVTMLDAASALSSHKSEQMFYRTDHHWTSEGAYAVFEATAAQMGITPLSYEGYPVTTSFQGTLASKSGRWSAKDTISVYEAQNSDVEYIVYHPDSGEKKATMFETDKLKEKDQYTLFFGGNYPLVEIKTTAESEKSLLVFKDSYANSYMQFLYPYYKSIIMVDPRYYYDNIETAMTSYGITDVLFLYSGDTLSADTNLADTLNAGNETGGDADPVPAAPRDDASSDAESVPETLSESSEW